MKKILITTFLLALGVTSFAQTKGVTFGIKAGVSLPTISSQGDASIYDGPSGLEFKTNTSLYIGGTVDLPISELFSIQPGLTLIGKGGKYPFSYLRPDPADGYNTYEGNVKISSMYLEIPVNAVFNFNVGKGEIFLGAGPYYAVAISGRVKIDGFSIRNSVSTPESSKRDLEFGDNKDVQRSDFGINFLAGYQLSNGWNIHAGYGLGLKMIDPYTTPDPTWTNRVVAIGIGFAF
ncbi:porin family protein [Pedobacter sp. AW1-32]|uniref:porin family protein n=1 Tax=Pedobacter sp. AW1-32 TaxID=3383026 RepID=UPI003FED5CE3